MSQQGLIFVQNNLNWILPVAVLELILKPIALWHAARNYQLAWFVVLVVFNTAGILPIIYLLFFQTDCNKK